MGSYVRHEIKGEVVKCLVRPIAKGKTILANISKTQLQSHAKTYIFTSCNKEQLPKSHNIHYSGSCTSTTYFKPSNSRLYHSASVPKELLHSFGSSASSQSHSLQHQPQPPRTAVLQVRDWLQHIKVCCKINFTQLMFRKGPKHTRFHSGKTVLHNLTGLNQIISCTRTSKLHFLP